MFEIENRQKSKTVAWEHPEPRLSHATPRIRPQWPGTPPVAACPPPGGPGAPGSSAALPLQIKQRAAHQNTPQPHVIDMDPFAASRKSSFFSGYTKTSASQRHLTVKQALCTPISSPKIPQRNNNGNFLPPTGLILMLVPG